MHLLSFSSLIHSHTPEDALTIASHQWVSHHACSLSVLSCKPARRLISPRSQPSSQLSGRLTNIPHHDHFFLPHADHYLSFSEYSFSEPLLMVMAPLGILISSPRPHHLLNCKTQDATKLHLFTYLFLQTPHSHSVPFSGYSFSEPLLMVMAPLGILISSPRPHYLLNCKTQDATKLHLFTYVFLQTPHSHSVL